MLLIWQSILPIFLLLSSQQFSVHAFPAECSACKIFAEELQRRIDNEKPRNHVDLRHRLDSEGNRYGKVIEYKNSELRAEELIDQLCSIASDYSLLRVNKTQPRWVKIKGAGALSNDLIGRVLNPQVDNVRARELGIYCGRLLENHEDEIVQAIMSGRMERSGPTAFICGTLQKACRPKERVEAEEPAEAELKLEDVPVGDEDVTVDAKALDSVEREWEEPNPFVITKPEAKAQEDPEPSVEVEETTADTPDDREL